MYLKDPLEYVTDFEWTIAEYFGAPYAVAVDCCTHALELCFVIDNQSTALVPKQTYISIPFMLEKIKHNWKFVDEKWEEYYEMTPKIIDAATMWRKDSYIPGIKMCLSFHHRKHLNMGRGGMILLDDKSDAELLSKMAYDGRERSDVPWVDQDISVVGYHYYMSPDKAIVGLKKFEEVSEKTPELVTYKDYPDLTLETSVFKNVWGRGTAGLLLKN